ncbi:hypothetical protein K439DRAFT_1620322 [Ramaria rubella]|nr:hypothetical protein K439DRAFT_1620322 [Ramaria rubella]
MSSGQTSKVRNQITLIWYAILILSNISMAGNPSSALDFNIPPLPPEYIAQLDSKYLPKNAQSLDLSKFGIQYAAINQDSLDTAKFWKDVENGHYHHFIVSPDQLFPFQGHLLQFALLMQKPGFKSKIKFLNIDEAHLGY